ncbi:MAG TPA: type III pantothenate kinase [Firmicutes bacterium]|nr:type III pantothenate kinase [Bacillota bacterium]
MILALDIGNTNIVAGVFRDWDLLKCWRLSTLRGGTADEYGMTLRNLLSFDGFAITGFAGVIIASVVPPLMPVFEEMARVFLGVEPFVVGPGVKTGIDIKYDNPREVGADRIVNAVAALEKYGGPLIVVDFGTATTLDAISEDGCYLGGAIAPGIGISTEALFRHAAKLPRVELAKPRSVIGKNTVESMQAGILYGFVGQVDELVHRMWREMDCPAKVIATGGLASLIASESKTIQEVDLLLTINGLRVIYERNKAH